MHERVDKQRCNAGVGVGGARWNAAAHISALRLTRDDVSDVCVRHCNHGSQACGVGQDEGTGRHEEMKIDDR